MSDVHSDTILIRTSDTVTRGRQVKPLDIDILAENMNLFLAQMNKVLEKTPQDVGSFRFTEFSVTVEISAKGALTILGSGIESEGKGGLVFKFERK